MKTLHAVPCKLCGRKGATIGGWCVMCMYRGVKSMQAMSAPLMTFLMENHAVQPGDKMPYGEELLGKLRAIAAPAKTPPVRDGADLQCAPTASNPNPPAGAGDGADQAGGNPAQ